MSRRNRGVMLRMLGIPIVCGLALALGSPVAARSEDDPPSAPESAEEMAARLANPADTPASLSFNLDFTEYQGDLPDAGSQRGFTFSAQPTIPITLESGRKIFIRPLLPLLVRQPTFDSTTAEWDDKFELGDMAADIAYGGVQKNGFLWLVGANLSIPTATDDAVGLDQWTLGPEVVVGLFKKWGVIGAIFNHRWDVWGNNRAYSVTGGQYFYAFPIFDRTWQIAASPTWSYNHNPRGDEKLTIPAGIGLAKTLRLGQMTWKFSAQYWHYLQQSDRFGGDQQLRFTITPVVNLPF